MPSKWYFAPIYQVYEAGLMNGVGQDLFAPNKTLNRATLVTVLYRMAGSPAVQGSGYFSDVPANSWYTEAVTWAAQNGVAKGYGQGIFAPGRAITRQEMVTMVFRFWQLQNQGDCGTADGPERIPGPGPGGGLGQGGHDLGGDQRHHPRNVR